MASYLIKIDKKLLWTVLWLLNFGKKLCHGRYSYFSIFSYQLHSSVLDPLNVKKRQKCYSDVKKHLRQKCF